MNKKVIAYDINYNPHEVNEADLVDTLRVYGIYIKNNKILMVRDPRADFWELPGGGVEEDETILDGLIREFKEETGLEGVSSEDRLIDRFIELFYSPKENLAWRADRSFYFIDDAKGEILSSGNGWDTAEVKFIDLKELKDLPIKPNIKKVLNKVIESYTVD